VKRAYERLGARVALGEAHARAVARERPGLPEAGLAKETARLERAPVVVACVVRPSAEDAVTAREDRDAVAAAVPLPGAIGLLWLLLQTGVSHVNVGDTLSRYPPPAYMYTLWPAWSMVAVLAFLANLMVGQLKRQTAAHSDARMESERRWALLAMVSAAARQMSAVEPLAVLRAVVDSVVALGFPTSRIYLEEEGDYRVVLPPDAHEDFPGGIDSLPSEAIERVLRAGKTVVVAGDDALEEPLRRLARARRPRERGRLPEAHPRARRDRAGGRALPALRQRRRGPQGGGGDERRPRDATALRATLRPGPR